jgi:hypothetical protein
MYFPVDLFGDAVKAFSGARMAFRVAGRDTPVLDELHDGLSPVRAHARVERVHDLAANAGAGQAAQPTDPGDTGDGDPADADDGFISDVIEWITDLFN